jgi:hypothetical protein
MIGAPVFRYVLTPGWAGDSLARAAQAVPSLDLNFAATKNVGPLVTFTRASSATYVGSDGLIKTAAVNEPRFDHDPTTGESLGLLVEEQRTNLVVRSEEFDNAGWGRSGATLPTVTANTSVAPDGTTTADLWTRAITGSNFISQAPAKAASAIQYTFSVFVKQSVGNFCALRCQGTFPNKVDVVFNISSGTISTAATVAGGTFTGPSASITAYPNGWYRLTVTATSDTALIYQCIASFSSNGVLIDGVDSVSNSAGLLWGAQLEAGAFPTSYIPTTTAAATRSADVASITGANFSSWYRQDEGTVFADVVSAPNNTIAQLATDISDAPGNERIFVRRSGAGLLGVAVIDGGVTQADVGAGPVISGGARYATAASYRLNSINLATNGQIGTEDATATIPTPDRMFIGQNFASTQQVNGTIRRLTFFPQRLPNSTLQAITQ